MPQLAPSANPAKEAKQFALLGPVCGITGLLFWFVAIAGLAFSARALILATRGKDQSSRTQAISGLLCSIIAMGYHFFG